MSKQYDKLRISVLCHFTTVMLQVYNHNFPFCLLEHCCFLSVEKFSAEENDFRIVRMCSHRKTAPEGYRIAIKIVIVEVPIHWPPTVIGIQ